MIEIFLSIFFSEIMKKKHVPVGPFEPTREMDRKQLFIQGWPNRSEKVLAQSLKDCEMQKEIFFMKPVKRLIIVTVCERFPIIV